MDAEKVDLESLSESLKALSNPKRLQLLRFLREPHYLEEIASELGMSRQAAQDHVGLLHDAGLLEKHAAQRPTGQVVEYRLVRARYFSLFEDLRILGATLPKSADEEALMRTVSGAQPVTTARADGPELVVIGGFRPGLRAPFHRGSEAPPMTLGRDPASGLLLDWDLMISNRHAEIRGAAKGHAVVDLFSRNGTSVNGARATAGQPIPLRAGDVLQLGRTMLVYRD